MKTYRAVTRGMYGVRSHPAPTGPKGEVKLKKKIGEINVLTLCDERANDTSANASGSNLYLYRRMNARRCKISFLYISLNSLLIFL